MINRTMRSFLQSLVLLFIFSVNTHAGKSERVPDSGTSWLEIILGPSKSLFMEKRLVVWNGLKVVERVRMGRNFKRDSHLVQDSDNYASKIIALRSIEVTLRLINLQMEGLEFGSVLLEFQLLDRAKWEAENQPMAQIQQVVEKLVSTSRELADFVGSEEGQRFAQHDPQSVQDLTEIQQQLEFVGKFLETDPRTHLNQTRCRDLLK